MHRNGKNICRRQYTSAIFYNTAHQLVLCGCILCCFFQPLYGQWFTTPQVLNGNPSETFYKSDATNSRLYIGWDDTYLYIAKKEFNYPVVIYFDLDPYFPVSGGSNANGNLLGVTHYNHTMDLPFRWDMALYWTPTGSGTSYIEYKERNGAGGFTTQTESVGILEDALMTISSINYGECKIKWSEINGSGGGRPASFNWYAYRFIPNTLGATHDFIDQSVPYPWPGINNPESDIIGTNKVYFYQTVPNTNSIGISDPFSFSLRSFETRGDYGYSSSNLSPVYDMTMLKELGGDQRLRIMSNITVTNNLALTGIDAGLSADGGNYTITMSGSNGIMHISNGAEMYGEYSGNLLSLTFNGYTTLQQVGGNTFDARTVTVIADKTLNANTASISSVATTLATGNIYGTVITTNLSGFSGTTLSTFRNGFTVWDMGVNSLVHYADASGGTQIVTARNDYGNITISGGGIKSFAGETSDVVLNSTLTFTDGMLYTGTNKVVVNNPAAGSITGYDNTQYINGTLRRKVNPTGVYDFPIGTVTQYEPAVINLNSSAGLDSITANYTATPQTPSSLTSNGPNACLMETTPVDIFLNYGYWSINSSPASPTVDYNITLTSNGHNNAAALVENHGIFKNETLTATTWSEAGDIYDADCAIDIPVGSSVSPVTVTNTGVNSFSNFAIGLNTTYILPITLTNFNGWYNGSMNELHWETYSEVNSDFFSIEKSIDGNVFSSIGVVDAQGFSSAIHNYVFYDEHPVDGIQYYRLRMTDKDGTFVYSNIIAIETDGKNVASIFIYPNPVQNNLHAQIVSAAETQIRITIYDLLGNAITDFSQAVQVGINTLNINTSTLARGNYMLTVTDNTSGETIATMFMK